MGILTENEMQRYGRQILLPEIGEEGQITMLKSRVLIVGAGGLGSPVALYLAAAGIGTIGMVDCDTVNMSNIHRQVLHGTADVGKAKTESAKETMNAINPGVVVNVYQERFTADRAMNIISTYDVVVDGSDNFPTKFLLNDAAFFAGKPYIFGGAVRFDGQASVFYPKAGGPCLRCMIPEIPSADSSPGCSQVGVLGIVPGLIGLVQAAEVVKLILKKGNPLMGRFLVYNCLEAEFRTFALSKNPACPLCGENPNITDLSGNYNNDSR